MPGRGVIVIGGSAGGLEALRKVVRVLPPDFPAAVFVVIHISADYPSILPEILAHHGPLPAAHARDGEEVRPGRIYVAAPNYHLTVQGGKVGVRFGPKVNAFRPAIDPLFRSAAQEYGPGVVGVLLSGGMMDGVAGLLAIRRDGGVVVVQDPADALTPELPRHALSAIQPDHTVPASGMGKLLGELVRGPVDAGAGAMPDTLARAEEAYRRDIDAQTRGERVGQVSVFSCPHCGGVMRQTEETRLAEFLCHIGHSYEGDALLGAQRETVETITFNLFRALKERALLARELAALARGRGDPGSEARLTGVAAEAERQLGVVEGGLLKAPPG